MEQVTGKQRANQQGSGTQTGRGYSSLAQYSPDEEKAIVIVNLDLCFLFNFSPCGYHLRNQNPTAVEERAKTLKLLETRLVALTLCSPSSTLPPQPFNCPLNTPRFCRNTPKV